MRLRRHALPLAALLLVAACGHSSSGAGGGGATPTPTGSATPAPVGGGPAGVWNVKGSDARGSFTGQIELVEAGAQYQFTRVIRYDSVTVEDSRELWWVWQGTFAKSGDALDATFALQRADFIRARGSLVRTDADKLPLGGAGHFAPVAGGWQGTWSGAGDGSEVWSALAPSGAAPIFATQRTLVDAHDPASASTKATMFSTFASYQALPDVAPYASNPAFQAAIHGFYLDRTDADFYRAHPTALRVVDKVVDDISLQETLLRANAFKWTLAGKAAYFDADTKATYIDPIAGTLVDSKIGNTLIPTGDGALWTSSWLASQAFRWQVTGDAEAMNNVATSIDAIDTMIEITGDPATFARTIRPASGAATGTWHAGTGIYAHLDWLEGGNNDMFKGLLYGNFFAWKTLCETPSGHDAICARIDSAVRKMADTIAISQAHGGNKLNAEWLAAYVTGESGYLGNAESEWLLQAETVKNGNAMVYSQGIADWSGTHLNFCSYVLFHELQAKVDLGYLGNDPAPKIAQGVDTSKNYFARQHMGLWSLAFAALGTAPDAAQAEDAKWRLREVSAPKFQADIDHRIHPEFVMSPYPSLPWKNDWTTQDRSQGLRGYPVFEEHSGVYAWKDNPLRYKLDTTGVGFPGADYSHAYWLGRAYGVIGAAE